MDKGNELLLELKNISKRFYGSYALKDASFQLRKGEVHILCGENGAGKSTLMKILAGVQGKDGGEILLEGRPVSIGSPLEARELGIAIVFQELSLSPTITVAENLFLNREFGRFFVNRKKMYAESRKILELVGLKCDPNVLLSSLSIAETQLVQIAKALSMNAKIIIMDEPVSSITEEDTDKLFELINGLKRQGVGIIYIDHRIENYKRIGDRVTILRDGCVIETLDVGTATKADIVERMVGREISQLYPKTSKPTKEVKLKVQGLTDDKIKNINLEIYKGEVFGLAGLGGAGRSEILRMIFGANKINRSGVVEIDGKTVRIRSPKDTMKVGMGYVPEDRKLQSLILFRPVSFNLSLAFLNLFGKGPFLNNSKENQIVDEQIRSMQIRMLSKKAAVKELSGGNQQKVVLSRWLINDKLNILLLDEPTRGVDVGVKYEIYKMIDELANAGITILLVTSELSELMGLCDRIAIVREGEISGILERDEFDQTAIMHLCVH